MLALSIRQPFAELILRGIKTVEYRTRATRIIGERFWIYASTKKLPVVSGQWSVKYADNIAVPSEKPPAWMIELAGQVGMIEPGTVLPTGVIVGSAKVACCELLVASGNLQPATCNTQPATCNPPPVTYAWHLVDIERIKTPRKPRGHPQPVWFKPF